MEVRHLVLLRESGWRPLNIAVSMDEAHVGLWWCDLPLFFTLGVFMSAGGRSDVLMSHESPLKLTKWPPRFQVKLRESM